MQVPGHLRRPGPGMADQHQQHRDDQFRFQRGGRIGLAAGGQPGPASLELAVAVGSVAEIDIDAAEALAAGAVLAHGGEQEGVHGHVQQGAEFPVSAAVLGFVEQAPDGGGEGTVAGEVDVAEGEQAEAVEAGGVAVGVEAAVVVVAAQMADLGAGSGRWCGGRQGRGLAGADRA